MQRSYNEMLGHILSPYNISKYEWRILACLHENDLLTVSDLAFMAQIDKTRTSRHVESLAQQDLIIRMQDKIDRRCAKVRLTTQGDCIYNAVNPLVTQLKNKLFNGISAEDYRIFLNVLKQAKNNFTELSAGKCAEGKSAAENK